MIDVTTRCTEASELAKLLLLLHRADEIDTTFEAEVHDWSRPQPTRTERLEAGDKTMRVNWVPGGRKPAPIDVKRRLWYERPSKLRIELHRGGLPMRIGVRAGDKWWSWSARAGIVQGALSVRDANSLPAFLDPPLVAPARLLAAFRFETVTCGVWRDRDVLVARARSRVPAPSGASAFEFSFDLNSGIMLRRAGYIDDRCVDLTEVFVKSIGVPIDSKAFSPDPSAIPMPYRARLSE